MRVWIGCAAALMVLGLAAAVALAHPKPGAHADVRVDVGAESVRFDVQMNVLFVDGLVSFARSRRDDVLPEEEAELLRGVRAYFGAEPGGPGALLAQAPNRVLIDGVETAPQLRELSIVRPEPETRPGFVQNPVLLIPRVHVIAEYPRRAGGGGGGEAAKEITMVWGTFPRDFLAADRDVAPTGDVEAVVSGEGRFELVRFTKAEPSYTWRSRGASEAKFAAPSVSAGGSERGRAPVGLVVLVLGGVALAAGAWRVGGPARGVGLAMGAALLTLVGLGAFLRTEQGRGEAGAVAAAAGWRRAPVLREAEAKEIFESLHANIYRAFDYSSEREVYDALAASVDGPMLDSVYADVHAGLVMQEEGGAMCRVKTVTPMETDVGSIGSAEAGEAASFSVKARWRVQGVVYHWGHSHERINEYAARYTVAARKGAWRIVGAVPVEQRRIQSEAQAASEAGVDTGGTGGAGGAAWPSAR